ncbi:MAG TPA: DUF4398 domain-containing protein [Wenzhouxiangellaceae bacterium]|nr:DUF4398 domain-containing protein [Wenzhouxiangellaceae bacterium]
MPSNLLKSFLALFLTLLALLTLAGCATTPADPDILLEADDAIELAQRTGARDHAPLELDAALELRNQAAARIEADEATAATRLAERAAVQARLAIVRAEGGRARSELERKRQDLERLENELRQAFGDAIDAGDES